jgi:hypothetical protein
MYENIIFPSVLYGYEIWWLTIREEHVTLLRVLENRVGRRIFELKRC